jgi:hypothetical protein
MFVNESCWNLQASIEICVRGWKAMTEPLHRPGTEQSDQRQNSKGEAERLADDD